MNLLLPLHSHVSLKNAVKLGKINNKNKTKHKVLDSSLMITINTSWNKLHVKKKTKKKKHFTWLVSNASFMIEKFTRRRKITCLDRFINKQKCFEVHIIEKNYVSFFNR